MQELLSLSNVISIIGIFVGLAATWITTRGTTRLLSRNRYRHAKSEIVHALSVSLGEGTAPSEQVVVATIRSVLSEEGISGDKALDFLKVRDVLDELVYRVAANQFLESTRRNELQRGLSRTLENLVEQSSEVSDASGDNGAEGKGNFDAVRWSATKGKGKYIAVGLVLIAGMSVLAGFALWTTEAVAAYPELSTPTVLSAADPIDIWFSPEGALLYVSQGGACLSVARWDPSGRSDVHSTHIKFRDRRQVEILNEGSDGGIGVKCIDRFSGRLPVFALSRDATLLAWVADDSIAIKSIAKPEQPTLFIPDAGAAATVSALALLDDRIAILYKDGLLKVIDPKSGFFTGGTSFGESWNVIALGEAHLVVASANSGDYAVVDLRDSENRVAVSVLATTDGLPIVVASVGATGCVSVVERSDGRVTQTCPGREPVALESPQRIVSLASLNEGRVLAASDLGLYILDNKRPFRKIAQIGESAPAHLAAQGNSLAYSRVDGVVFSVLENRLHISQQGQSRLLFLSLSTSGLVLVALLFQFVSRLSGRRRLYRAS